MLFSFSPLNFIYVFVITISIWTIFRWHWLYSLCCPTITTICFQSFFHCPNRSSVTTKPWLPIALFLKQLNSLFQCLSKFGDFWFLSLFCLLSYPTTFFLLAIPLTIGAHGVGMRWRLIILRAEKWVFLLLSSAMLFTYKGSHTFWHPEIHASLHSSQLVLSRHGWVMPNHWQAGHPHLRWFWTCDFVSAMPFIHRRLIYVYLRS